MSEWCPTHKTYSAKKEPNSLCGRCWSLWFYRCPEDKYLEPVTPEDVAWAQKHLAGEASRDTPRKG